MFIASTIEKLGKPSRADNKSWFRVVFFTVFLLAATALYIWFVIDSVNNRPLIVNTTPFPDVNSEESTVCEVTISFPTPTYRMAAISSGRIWADQTKRGTILERGYNGLYTRVPAVPPCYEQAEGWGNDLENVNPLLFLNINKFNCYTSNGDPCSFLNRADWELNLDNCRPLCLDACEPFIRMNQNLNLPTKYAINGNNWVNNLNTQINNAIQSYNNSFNWFPDIKNFGHIYWLQHLNCQDSQECWDNQNRALLGQVEFTGDFLLNMTEGICQTIKIQSEWSSFFAATGIFASATKLVLAILIIFLALIYKVLPPKLSESDEKWEFW